MSEDALFSVADHVILVTGAGRGNGLSIARGLAQMRAHVIGLDLHFPSPASFKQIVCDITQEDQIEAAVRAVMADHGRIDGLVNNAGISLSSDGAYSRARFERTLAVNTLAPLRLSWLVAESMKERGEGSIVNVTSLGGRLGFPDNPAYQASKAALQQITRAMALDYGGIGVRVNSVCPGYILTDMTRASYDTPELKKARSERTVLNRWGQPEDLVGACVFLLSRASSYITGIEIPVDGGWLAKGL